MHARVNAPTRRLQPAQICISLAAPACKTEALFAAYLSVVQERSSGWDEDVGVVEKEGAVDVGCVSYIALFLLATAADARTPLHACSQARRGMLANGRIIACLLVPGRLRPVAEAAELSEDIVASQARERTLLVR